MDSGEQTPKGDAPAKRRPKLKKSRAALKRQACRGGARIDPNAPWMAQVRKLVG